MARARYGTIRGGRVSSANRGGAYRGGRGRNEMNTSEERGVQRNPENPGIAELVAQQLEILMPTIVAQVTAALGGNLGNENEHLDDRDKAIPLIHGTTVTSEPTTNPTNEWSSERTTDKSAENDTLPRGKGKRKAMGESSEQLNAKKQRWGKGHVAANPGRRNYKGQDPYCAMCTYHHPISIQCHACYNCKKVGHVVKNCKEVTSQKASINTRNPAGTIGACFECGDTNHYRDTCPKLNRQRGPTVANPTPLQVVYPDKYFDASTTPDSETSL